MKRFIKTTEAFTCENCGIEVVGNGYTNHCPLCLWSKHVDINPGDRASDCQGLMEPIALENKNGEQVIVHRCVVCGFQKKNKVAENDSFDELLLLI